MLHPTRALWFVPAFAFCLLASAGATAGQLDGLYVCRRVSAPPKIDGVIDAKEWSGTDEAGGFSVTTSEAPAPVDTTFRLAYDAQRLYFRIRCAEPNKQSMRAKAVGRDSDVYSDDCIELAIDPPHDHATIFKFMLNSLGTLSDYQSGFAPWDADAEAAAGGGDGFWTVELSIPFAELSRDTPKHGEVWGLNVFRERYAGGRPELFNWANSFGVFTWPKNLAHVVFQDANQPLPANPRLHPDSWLNLTPEVARHAPLFEGRPWSLKEAEFDQEQSLRSRFETPHIDMAGPRKSGPIRALAFVKMRDAGGNWIMTDTNLRDFVELGQRFDVEPTAVMITDNGLFGAKAGARRMRALLTDRYDVYMFVNCSPKDLPAKESGLLADRVNAGAGVLFSGNGGDWVSERGTATDDRQNVAGPFPVQYLANYDRLINAGMSGVAEGSYPVLATYRIGKGRAAVLLPRGDLHALTPSMEYTPANLIDYEYWIGLAGAATLWAAGKEPAVRITLPQNENLNRASLPANLNIGFAGAGPLTAEVSVRDSNGKRVRILRQNLTVSGNLTLGVTIPVLAQDDYFLEARVLSGESVTGFSATRLTVTGKDYIPSLKVDREFFERGQTITGSFSLADMSNLRGPAVRTDMVTSDGRDLARTEYPTGSSGSLRFAFKVGDDTTPAMRVRVTVTDLLGTVQSKTEGFGAPDRKRGDFNFLMWDTHPDPLGIYSARSMSKAGFNVFLQWPPSPTAVQAGWSAAPYTTRITNQTDASGSGLPVCWNDAEASAKEIARVVANQAEVRKYGVWCYSLGDENDTFHGCLNPKCLDAYRKFLKEQYGRIDALNASWGSSYKSFDEVQLLRGEDFRNQDEAFQSGAYPRWCDRQVFVRRTYANACARFAAGFRKQDPKAITGFEGAGVFGDDPDAIFDAVGMWNTYASTFDDILRTLSPRQLIRGNWMGYTKDIDGMAYVAWRSICMGANSLWWWRDDGIGLFRGLLRPTLDLYPAVRALADEMQPVRNGLGEMLMNANPEDDGVAVLYSVESALSVQIPTEIPFGQAAASHTGVIGALKDSGLQFRYLTPRGVAAGALKGVRVLFLPRATAMDPKTAASIRAFVQNGGVVIADIRPAVFDQHLKALKRGALDDVFGIRQTVSGRRISIFGPLALRFQGRTLDLRQVRGPSDAACAPAGARPGGWVHGAPVVLVHPFGKGQAALLNFNMACYAAMRNTPAAVDLRGLITSACEIAGVRPRVTMTAWSGGPVLMTEPFFWRAGSAQLMSLRKEMYGVDWAIPVGGSGPESVKVQLPSPKVVYDLRTGKCLGRVSTIKTTLRTGYANFYGLFDKPLAPPAVTCTAQPNQGGTTLKATIGPAGATTAAVVQLIDPSGATAPWSRRVVLLDKNPASASWQLPVGSSGKWTVEAKELFTGKSVNAAVLLTGEPTD